MHLPYELQLIIADQLCHEDFINLISVNSYFHTLINHSTRYYRRHYNNWHANQYQIIDLSIHTKPVRLASHIVGLKINVLNDNFTITYALDESKTNDVFIKVSEETCMHHIIYIPTFIRDLHVNKDIDELYINHLHHLSCDTLNVILTSWDWNTLKSIHVQDFTMDQYSDDIFVNNSRQTGYLVVHDQLYFEGHSMAVGHLDIVCDKERIEKWLENLSIHTLTVRQCHHVHLRFIHENIRYLRLVGSNITIDLNLHDTCKIYFFHEYDEGAQYYAHFEQLEPISKNIIHFQ